MTSSHVRIKSRQHTLKTEWLTRRARKWMKAEFPANWWLMTFDADGNPIVAGTSKDYQPSGLQMETAHDVCRYCNLYDNNQGAWMFGFVQLDGRDYMPYILLKDYHGNILLSVRYKERTEILQTYSVDDYVSLAMQALQVWRDTCAATGLRPELNLKESD